MENNTNRTYRLGSISTGLTLVGAGTLLILAQLGYLHLATVGALLLPGYCVLLGLELLLTRLVLDVRGAHDTLRAHTAMIVLTVLLLAGLWALAAFQSEFLPYVRDTIRWGSGRFY